MTTEMLKNYLGVCGLINIGVLMLWFGMFIVARDWIYKMHTKWFRISDDSFDALHYGGMGIFKLCIFLFNIVPYLALLIVG